MTTILAWVGSFIFSLGGGAAIVWALSSWYGKVWAGKILEKDRAAYQEQLEILKIEGREALENLRGQTEKELFVHRLQFEKEFEAYVKLWEKADNLRGATISLDLGLASNGSDQPQEDSKQQLRHDHSQAMKEFGDIIQTNRPFYSVEVHDAAWALMRLCFQPTLASVNNLTDQEQRDVHRSVAEKITPCLDILCDRIRERIVLRVPTS